MSQQLTISSLFSALALVGLCMVTAIGDRLDANVDAPQALAQSEQAKRAPGLPL